MKTNIQPTKEQTAVLVASGSYNKVEAIAAQTQLAEALVTPLRQGVLNGDITGGIFQQIMLTGATGTSTPEFPLDLLAPGLENEYVGYHIPKQGYMPQKSVSGDYVVIPTYATGNSIDWPLKYARDARWDIVSRCLEVMKAGMVKKNNDDAWHCLISAAKDRGVAVFDSDASGGQFTKRVVSLAKLIMRRNGGGNSTSINRGKLTDVFMSPEAMEDIRNWNVDQVDEVTRREIFLANETMSRVFGVNLHDIDELGEGQEYQTYYTSTLSGVLPGSTKEIAIGLDLSSNDSFVNPVREELQIFADDSLHRAQREGYYCWQEQGWGVLDGRRVLILAI